MKKQKTIPKIIFCLMILTQLMGIVYAKEIEIEAANRVANKKILQLGKSEIIFVGSFFKLNGDNKNSVLAYIFNLQPRGYIVVAADTDIPPVIAYSFTNNIGVNNSENNVLVQLLQTDIQLRISNIPSLSKTIIDSRNKLWSQFLTEEIQLHYYQNNFQH